MVMVSQYKNQLEVLINQANEESNINVRTYLKKVKNALKKLIDAKELAGDDTEVIDIISQTENLIFDLEDSVEQEERQEREERREREERQQQREHELNILKLNNEKEVRLSENIRSANAKDVSIKLPKLSLSKFNGNVQKWQAFWDAFSSSVHSNSNLNQVDKFNYLRSSLEGDAEKTIAGLELTDSNYTAAIDILKERFGRQDMVEYMHFNKLHYLPSANDNTKSLRYTLNEIENHLRSLESYKVNNETSQMIILIKSKFPRSVMKSLEIRKDSGSTWTLKSLLNDLQNYVAVQEKYDVVCFDDNSNYQPNNCSTRKFMNTAQRYDDVSFDVNSKYQRNNFPTRKFMNTAQTLSVVETVTPSCRFCNRKHWSDECNAFPSAESRRRRIVGSCENCLKPGHQLSECKRQKPCFHCKKRNLHHSSLCPQRFSKPYQRKVAELLTPAIEDALEPEESLLASGESTLMQTAYTKVTNNKETESISMRIFFDTGSHRSYVTENLAKSLKLKPKKTETLKVYTFGSKEAQEIETPIALVKIQLQNNQFMQLIVNIVPQITGSITQTSLKHEISKSLKNLKLADTLLSKDNGTVDFLIGNDYYWDIIECEKKEIRPGLYLVDSKLGWILTGRHKSSGGTQVNSTLLTLDGSPCYHSEIGNIIPELSIAPKFNLERFWDLDTLGIKESPTKNDDDKALENFNDTVESIDGRYQVTWPWKEDVPPLPDNRELALGRLKSILKRMKSEPEQLKKYNEIIQDQLNKGIIEQVEKNTQEGELCHYIPHHAVITPQKTTTKVRIVYDASAKTKVSNKSLNECLYRGPVILENLCGLLLRFRTHRIAIVSDIEKAFLQVGLKPKERDVVRFFWLNDLNKPPSGDNLVIYRFTRVPFGVISSPFLLGATIRYHLNQSKSLIADQIKENIYVDNVITGTNSVENANQFYDEAKGLFKDISMNLREWNTNSCEFRDGIRDNDKSVDETMKILGIKWNTKNDDMTIHCPEIDFENTCVTKRQILKTVAGIFDPMGLFSPVTLLPKLLLQNLWSEHINWDSPLEKDAKYEWNSIYESLLQITHISFPRYLGVDTSKQQTFQLLCFCDASAKAYATVIYLQIKSESCTKTCLLFSKSRVAPKKALTIPRLELLALLIGVRSVDFITRELRLPISKSILWTDSQCVLHWLKSCKQLPIFIENRLKEIKATNYNFRYIKSELNPADIASRGTDTKSLMDNKLWWHGPEWLQLPEKLWPNFEFHEINEIILSEIEKSPCGAKVLFETSQLAGEGPEGTDFRLKPDNFSTLYRLLKITAWVQRFINNSRNTRKTLSYFLTEQEMSEARLFWEKHTQNSYFKDIQNDLKIGKNSQIIQQLNLNNNENGVIRCHGRLIYTDLSLDAKCPKLLPKNSYFTELVIKDVHSRLLHAGVSHTLAKLRNKYWVPQGRSTVKNILRKCLICKRCEGGPFKLPSFPPLPRKRVTPSSPFTYVGLDYFGPLYSREDLKQSPSKVYVCLFTCMCTRAIHLELISDMSTDTFLLGFRRFISRRGVPKEILSDNASHFKLARKTIDKAWSRITDNINVKSYLAENDIKWNFITDFAPWMGGFYERLIGLVKRALRKTFGSITLNWEKLETIIQETEATVNCRPLTYVGEEFNLSHILSPADFLSLNPKTGYPEIEDSEVTTYNPKMSTRNALLENWKRGQRLLIQFWKTWTNDYLKNLRERTQHQHKNSRISVSRTPRLGEIVLIKENLPRGTWKLAKITSINEGNDAAVRSVELMLSTRKFITRPMSLLYPLEVSEEI